MDENFKEFLGNYNQYITHLEDESYLLTEKMIMKKLDEEYLNKVNIYDKISVQFPTIRKFILEFYCKIYIGGKQLVMLKMYNCPKCNNNFTHNIAATIEDNKIIHKTCGILIKDKNIPVLPHNTMCLLCDTVIDEKDENIVMDKNIFYHKLCCVNKVKNTIKDFSCNICSKVLFPTMTKNRFECCRLKKDKNIMAHVLCAKNNVSENYSKTPIHTSFNKCGICNFYILDDGKYMHEICKNIN